jgi:hypothetical protein
MDDITGTIFNLKSARNLATADDALELDRHVKFSGSGRVVGVPRRNIAAGWSGLGRGLVGQPLPHVMSARVRLFRWGHKGTGTALRGRRPRGKPGLVWIKKQG